MATPGAPVPAATSDPVTAWVWGGALLIASAVLQMAQTSMQGGGAEFSPVTHWLGVIAFAGALLLFAFGWQGRGSIVARQVPGMVAMTVLALWPLVEAAVTAVLPIGPDLGSAVLWSYSSLIIWVGAALVAVVAIGRARVLPHPWRWAPAWGLALVAGFFLLVQVVGAALAPTAGQQVVVPLFSILSAVTVLAPVLLGVLGLVLGLTRRHARPVQVYPPTPPAAPIPPTPPV